MKHFRTFVLLLPLALGPTFLPAQESKFEPPPSKPLSPEEEAKTFQLAKGFSISLVACEPDVVDPVALAFDEHGRLFIAEMHGYPNGGLGTGMISSGKIKMLRDKDGDGKFETVTVFAEGLRLPTSVMPWNGGLLVANAPDLIFLEDTDRDGKADRRRVLYTGFDLSNIQQMVNSLQWGLDNWVHATCGGKGGTITSPEKENFGPLVLRGRGIRFKPDEKGVLEPASGGGQFGLAPDALGFWFTNTNSQVLRHIVLPDHYLARNPSLLVSATTLDIHEEGTAPKVNRISPFEAWRVERTRRRKETDPKRFAKTELVPGGFITSACSPIIYLGGAFPKGYEGNAFVCDPANNLIHRMILEPKGPATFVAKRALKDTEFLASTDNWFRPTNMTIGPDGALYITDFYREVIETPLSLPEDMKKVLVLESQKRGRIWRIAATERGAGDDLPLPGKSSDLELVQHLGSANSWKRYTAQRLLIQRQAREQKAALMELARKGDTPVSRIHALWTLHGLELLDDATIQAALYDVAEGVRIHALRLAEPRLEKSKDIFARAVMMFREDSSPRIRFQLALSLGQSSHMQATFVLAHLAQTEGADPWMQTAILSSASGRASQLVGDLIPKAGEKMSPMLPRVAQMVGASTSEEEVINLLRILDPGEGGTFAPWHFVVLDSLVLGWQARGITPESLWTDSRPDLRAALKPLKKVLARADQMATSTKVPIDDRVRAVRLVGMQPLKESQKTLGALLTAATPPPLQLAAVRAIAQYTDPGAATLLLSEWPSYSPTLRREVVEALLARPQRARALLDAIEAKKVQPVLIEPARLDQLRNHADAAIRKRAAKLLAAAVLPERAKVLDEFQKALDLKGDVARGRMVFRKNCITCHRLETVGVEVGADLQSILPGKTPERLLVDILDPSREVDPRFLDYVVETKSGRIVTGIMAAESASSLTLRRAEKVEETLLRSDLESIRASARSIMPEGLERQIGHQEMADLIEYLLEMGRKK